MRWVILLLFALVPGVQAIGDDVGVSPSRLDLGILHPGEQKIVTITLTSTSPQEFIVSVPKEPATLDFYNHPDRASLLSNASEQDILSWIHVLDNPVLLTPLPDSVHVGAGDVRSAADVTLVIRVPSDAEPGSHVAYIHPIPRKAPASGAGAAVIATVMIPVYFRVPGEVVRSVQVLDIAAADPVGPSTPIITTIKNTGTVTVTARAREIRIGGNGVTYSQGSSIISLPPGKSDQLLTMVPSEMLPPGTYDAAVDVTYTTGSVSFETNIFLDVTARIISAPAPESALPFWMFLLPFILLGALWYSRRKRF